jgi:hypothetical protein
MAFHICGINILPPVQSTGAIYRRNLEDEELR